MGDDQASDERLMKELDRIYLRISDLERPQSPAPNNPGNVGQDSGQEVKLHEKVIPFPKPPQQGVSRDPTRNPTRIPVTSRKASEDVLERKRKPWYKSYLFLPFPVISLLIVCLIIFTPLVIGPRNKDKTKRYQQTFSVPTKALAPAETEDFGQKIEREQEPEMQSDPTTKPVVSLIQKSHYTVQVGAFENWEVTCRLMEELRDKGLECRWAEIQTENGGFLYRVFSGYFESSNEANEYMRKCGMVNDYPGSFVREISSNEAQSVLPSNAN